MPEETEPTEETDQEPNDLKILRKKAKQADEFLSRAEAAERRLALRDAGIPNTPLGKLFEKGYDGELSTEAITAAATEYGVLSPPAEENSEEEVASHERMAQAASGSVVDPKTDWDAELKKAKSEEEFMETYRRSGRPLKTG